VACGPKGLVEFIDNLKHQRSKFVRLTRKGDGRYREFNTRFPRIASTLSTGLIEGDICGTTEIVRLAE